MERLTGTKIVPVIPECKVTSASSRTWPTCSTRRIAGSNYLNNRMSPEHHILIYIVGYYVNDAASTYCRDQDLNNNDVGRIVSSFVALKLFYCLKMLF
jgi:hypothetical protein